MESDGHIEALQHCASYAAARRLIKNQAFGCPFFGAPATVLAGSGVINEMSALIKDVRSAKEKKRDDYIQFDATTFAGTKIFSGKLMQGTAFLIDQSGTHVFFVRPEEFTVELKRDDIRKKKNKAVVTVKDKEFKSKISQVSIQRIANWKMEHDGKYE